MENINNILDEATRAIAAAQDLATLEQARTKYLGKKGEFTQVLKSLSSIPSAERPKIGQLINDAKDRLTISIAQRTEELSTAAVNAQLAGAAIDVTLPGRGQDNGTLHPITKVMQRIEKFFASMGFIVVEGPEIEDEYHNFTALNIPASHPARTQHDTFYLQNSPLLLRTHTSPVQIRAMQKMGAPLRIITPGRVYRCDYDATHSPMFNQIEGLLVDEKINLGNLKWILHKFLEYFFGRPMETRLRPSYFPFTEPSAEVDVKWESEGKSRWLELLGCGMVHPKVLEAGGIDSKRYTGLAFGLGIDRFAMLYYGVNDLRQFFENDLQFLQCFNIDDL